MVSDKGNDHVYGDAYSLFGDAKGTGKDFVLAGREADTVVGDAAAGGTATGGGDDTELGDIGNDLLIGDNLALDKNAKLTGGGADKLRGGKNDDHFIAGPARDECKGGSGTDKDLSHPACEQQGSIP
jgi:Ca2+-binding RTX toxin-like protein